MSLGPALTFKDIVTIVYEIECQLEAFGEVSTQLMYDSNILNRPLGSYNAELPRIAYSMVGKWRECDGGYEPNVVKKVNMRRSAVARVGNANLSHGGRIYLLRSEIGVIDKGEQQPRSSRSSSKDATGQIFLFTGLFNIKTIPQTDEEKLIWLCDNPHSMDQLDRYKSWSGEYRKTVMLATGARYKGTLSQPQRNTIRGVFEEAYYKVPQS